jgi:saccharopine dehydrogenase-like NADP-dependent oxidoreductase
VTIDIQLCRTTPSNSLVRLYGLNLLINMSVLEYLHDEYMKDLNELGLLIESTFQCNEEALSAGKILANLSTNKLNLEELLKMTVRFIRKTKQKHRFLFFKGY